MAATDVDPEDALRLPPESSRLWNAVDALLEHAAIDGIVAHRLGPLEVRRLRGLSLPVPPRLLPEERLAALAMATAIPLLERIRGACDGPLVLFKGPEVAGLYPPGTRPFKDLDLLVPDPEAVQRSLLDAGFVFEGESPPQGHRHLRALRWPGFSLTVEVHAHAGAKARFERFSPEILAASVPSSLGVDGILAPSPIDHVLILAVHGWSHRPFRDVRDLVDVAAASLEADEGELERLARAWGIAPIWRLTRAAVDALFSGGPRTVPLRVWGRHLEPVREPSLFEFEFGNLIAGFWWLPPHRALARAARLIRQRATLAPGQTRRGKLERIWSWTRASLLPVSKRSPSPRSRNEKIRRRA